MSLEARGGIEGVTPELPPSPRKVSLLQRKQGKVGGGLGKTTGWIHRLGLEKKGVQMMPGCEYRRIDDEGLHITVADARLATTYTTELGTELIEFVWDCR